MSDMLEIKTRIETAIQEIGKYRRQIDELGRKRAEANMAYEMELAKTLFLLGEQETVDFDGQTHKQPPVSVREKIARGIVANYKYEAELADSNYKACIANLEALKTQLNGFQSINRHLDN